MIVSSRIIVSMEREELVTLYFRLGLNNKEIIKHLSHLHGDNFSLRTLKRLLHRKGFFRRKAFSDLLDVASFIIQEYDGNGQLHGYKWMHQKCLHKNAGARTLATAYIIR
jgi:hypothetical protein